MKNTSFRRRYTKTSLTRIRAEYVKNLESESVGSRFLCHSSSEFAELWKEFKSEIIENVINHFGEMKFENFGKGCHGGAYRGGDCLLYGNKDSAENRIKFLDYEIERLSKK